VLEDVEVHVDRVGKFGLPLLQCTELNGFARFRARPTRRPYGV
jgi:hypothetical protein